MKSKLFDNFDPEEDRNKALQRDLGRFLGMSGPQRDACVAALGELAISYTRDASRQLMEKVQRETGCSGVTVEGVLHMLRYFLSRMVDLKTRDDEPQAWGEDLVSYSYLKPDETPIFIDHMDRIRREIVPNVTAHLRQREYSAGVLPSLREIGITVELRAVREDIYHWTTPVDQYQPRIIDVVPVASIHIGVDTGYPEDFFFQVDENELQLLIDDFAAAKKDIMELRASVSFSRRPNGSQAHGS